MRPWVIAGGILAATSIGFWGYFLATGTLKIDRTLQPAEFFRLAVAVALVGTLQYFLQRRLADTKAIKELLAGEIRACVQRAEDLRRAWLAVANEGRDLRNVTADTKLLAMRITAVCSLLGEAHFPKAAEERKRLEAKLIAYRSALTGGEWKPTPERLGEVDRALATLTIALNRLTLGVLRWAGE